MSETLEHTDDLIDHAAITDHQNRINIAAERLSVANALQRQEQAAYNAADAAYKAGVAGRGGDRHALKLALEDAARRLAVETEGADAARAELQHQNGRTDTVRGLAHRKMYEVGILQRVAAARRADAARAALASASEDYKAATASMRLAMQNGLPDWHGGAMDGADLVRTEQEERRHWTGRGIDPDRPHHGWQPD